MYQLASSHYSSLNNAAFTTPSIIITSLASFLSFAGATDPSNSKNVSLTVGLLGTVATILTALQAAYKYDTQAETYRSAGAEYLLLTTKLVSVMRKERVYQKEWDALWAEIEMRTTELQKKTTYTPNRDLVDRWARKGKLSVKSMSGAMLPPWLLKYQPVLEDDGIQDEEDIRFVTDDIFDLWALKNYRIAEIVQDDGDTEKKVVFDKANGTQSKYPAIVIAKLKSVRDRLVELRAPSNKTNLKLVFKPATSAALRKRGIMDASDLRLTSDAILDGVVQELLMNDTPPMPLAWSKLEELRAEMLYYGKPCPDFRYCCPRPLSAGGKERIKKVVDKNWELTVSGRLAAADGKFYDKTGKEIKDPRSIVPPESNK
jgi:hypothetical protein